MDYLWTPWRYQYISQAGETEECIFCLAGRAENREFAAGGHDHSRLVVHRGDGCFVVLNRFPYTSGHVMVVPYEHLATLEALPDSTAIEMMRLAQRTETILRKLYRPEGLNLGINLGKCAGAGVAGHVHLHVLPRWTGDANFMSVVGETRVLPEDLETSWQKLSRAYQETR